MSNRRLDESDLRAQFIAWLMTQDPAESYHWDNPHKCACGQFASAIGKRNDWFYSSHDGRAPSEQWSELDAIAALTPRTFGALLLRMRYL
jgi:hypothetical protein